MVVMASPYFWKIALAISLVAMVVASASARPPRKPLPRHELRWPLLGALTLYAVGSLALIEHRSHLAVWVFAAGICTSALTAWLSRSDHGGGPPGGDDPQGDEPPPDPHGVPRFDWAQFERDLRAYTARSRHPVSSR